MVAWCLNNDTVVNEYLATREQVATEIQDEIGIVRRLPKGSFEDSDRAAIGRIIDELALAIQCSEQNEWQDQLVYFPLTQLASNTSFSHAAALMRSICNICHVHTESF